MFQIGDVVYLKSGGPSMVVQDASQNGNCCICLWWDDKELVARTFHTDTLTKSKTEPSVSVSQKADLCDEYDKKIKDVKDYLVDKIDEYFDSKCETLIKFGLEDNNANVLANILKQAHRIARGEYV